MIWLSVNLDFFNGTSSENITRKFHFPPQLIYWGITIESGYAVSQALTRKAVSSHSLHGWGKALIVAKTARRASGLFNDESADFKLRVLLQRTEEAPDIVKTTLATLTERRNMVPILRRASS